MDNNNHYEKMPEKPYWGTGAKKQKNRIIPQMLQRPMNLFSRTLLPRRSQDMKTFHRKNLREKTDQGVSE